VPKRPSGRTVGYEALLAQRLKGERELRQWSFDKVAERMTDAGCTMSGSAVWAIEKEPPRAITVDEFMTFAHVYEMRPEDLLGSSPHKVDSSAIRLQLNHMEKSALEASLPLARFLSQWERLVRENLQAIPQVEEELMEMWPLKQGKLEIKGAQVTWSWKVPV
jgi:hypothetical protein